MIIIIIPAMLRIEFFRSRCVKNESAHDDDHSVTESLQQILVITECIIFDILGSR
jgi:hypothetical protein